MKNILCKIGIHKWMVHRIGITGEAHCDKCPRTGIATPDGIINKQVTPTKER